MKTKRKTAPARIWLLKADPEITWHEDLGDGDTEYVRIDIHKREVSRLKRIVNMWNDLSQNIDRYSDVF